MKWIAAAVLVGCLIIASAILATRTPEPEPVNETELAGQCALAGGVMVGESCVVSTPTP